MPVVGLVLLTIRLSVISLYRVEGAQRTEHRPAPPTFNTGCEGETVTEGGELGFVRRIIHDSLILRTQITSVPLPYHSPIYHTPYHADYKI